jgi:hypothetical protein
VFDVDEVDKIIDAVLERGFKGIRFGTGGDPEEEEIGSDDPSVSGSYPVYFSWGQAIYFMDQDGDDVGLEISVDPDYMALGYVDSVGISAVETLFDDEMFEFLWSNHYKVIQFVESFKDHRFDARGLFCKREDVPLVRQFFEDNI